MNLLYTLFLLSTFHNPSPMPEIAQTSQVKTDQEHPYSKKRIPLQSVQFNISSPAEILKITNGNTNDTIYFKGQPSVNKQGASILYLQASVPYYIPLFSFFFPNASALQTIATITWEHAYNGFGPHPSTPRPQLTFHTYAYCDIEQHKDIAHTAQLYCRHALDPNVPHVFYISRSDGRSITAYICTRTHPVNCSIFTTKASKFIK